MLSQSRSVNISIDSGTNHLLWQSEKIDQCEWALTDVSLVSASVLYLIKQWVIKMSAQW